MAVTGIRKVSSYTLLALSLISVAVFALFFLGGSTVNDKGNVDYNFTDILLYWTYFLGGATVLAALAFGCLSAFAPAYKPQAEARTATLIAVAVLLGSLVLGYFVLGSGEPIANLNADAQAYNTPGWLKLTDMFLYSTYISLGVTVCTALFYAVKKSFSK